MSDNERKALGPEATSAYDRMLERIEERLAEAESRTWEQVKAEIEEAVEFEEGLARLTREEIDLLSAYLRRDLGHLLGFLQDSDGSVREWLKLDLELIEQRLVELLFSIADRTRLETVELDQRLEHGPGHYMSGEVATAGVLRCMACGKMLCLTRTTHLSPCEECGSKYFERITAQWPHEPEMDD